MRFTRWGQEPADSQPPVDVLAAAAKASRGEPLTDAEMTALGRHIPGGAERLAEKPEQEGLERIPVTSKHMTTEEEIAVNRVATEGGEWIHPRLAEAAGVPPGYHQRPGNLPGMEPTPDQARPDVRGTVTTAKHPDMSDPHIPGVTYWLYRWWGRDATTGQLYLLYVGETEQRPVERLIEHLTSRTAPARHFKHLLWAWEVDPRVFPSKKAAETAEDRAVKTEWPSQNTQLQSPDNTRLWTVRQPRPGKRVAPRVSPATWWTITAILAPTIGLWLIAAHLNLPLTWQTALCPLLTALTFVALWKTAHTRRRARAYRPEPTSPPTKRRGGRYR